MNIDELQFKSFSYSVNHVTVVSHQYDKNNYLM